MSTDDKRKKGTQKKKRQVHTMDVILVIIGAALLAFTVTMIVLFRRLGAVPDTLITCVFAALAGECGIMGWIKTTKDRYKEREWEQEDKREAAKEKRKREE